MSPTPLRLTRQIAGFVVIAGLSTAGVAACNSSGSSNNSAASQLQQATQSLRDIAVAGSYSQIRSQVLTLDNLASSLEASGQISSAEAQQIEDAALGVESAAQPVAKPTTSSPSPTPTTTSPSPTPTTSSPSPTPTTTSPSPILSTSTPATTSSDATPTESTSSPGLLGGG